MLNVFRSTAFSVVAVSFAVVACSASNEGGTETTGVTQAALGESACATNPLYLGGGGSDAGVGVPITSAGVVSYPSAPGCFLSASATGTGAYGSSGCSAQYILEVHGEAGGHLATVSPAAVPTDQATCEATFVSLALYGTNGFFGPNGVEEWTLIGTTEESGKWVTGGFGGCWFDTGAGSANEIQVPYGYQVIRAVGSAWHVRTFRGHTFHQQRDVIVSVQPTPC